MTLLIHFLIATVFIVALILLRLFADRRALRERLRNDPIGKKEECISCALKITQLTRNSPLQS